MKRWCILATPRSGSTWFEQMIYAGVRKNLNRNDQLSSLKLGEFILPEFYFKAKKEFKLDLNKNLIEIKKTEVNENKNDFFKNRTKLILDNNLNQFLTMRIFPNSNYWNNEIFNYFTFLNVLSKKNFNFVALLRNNFDRIISLHVMVLTNIVHRGKLFNDNFVFYMQNAERKYDFDIKNITIDKDEIKYVFKTIKQEVTLIKELIKYTNCSVVNYETIFEDCKKNNIPINPEVHIVKTYQRPYNEIITNYEEIKNLYEQVLENDA